MDFALYEELQYNAFPPLQTVLYDGWSVRFGGGFTYRVNCANPMQHSTLPLDEKIDYVEREYFAANLDSIIKIHDGMDEEKMRADKLLEDRGYALERRGNIFTCDLKHYPVQSSRAAVSTRITREWLAGFLNMNGTSPGRQWDSAICMIQNIHYPVFAASIFEDAEMIACGLGVYERGHVGLYDIFVAERHRRKGLGGDICNAIMAAGKDMGAHTAYLQVLSDNLGARSLYRSMGYCEGYEYWFRIKRKA